MTRLSPYLFYIYVGVVLILLVIPTSDTGIKLNAYFLGIRTDHYIHALIFTPFVLSAKWAFKRQAILILFFIGVFFCAFCEGLHYFIPYRQFSLGDYFANLTGMCIGFIIALFSYRNTIE